MLSVQCSTNSADGWLHSQYSRSLSRIDDALRYLRRQRQMTNILWVETGICAAAPSASTRSHIFAVRPINHRILWIEFTLPLSACCISAFCASARHVTQFHIRFYIYLLFLLLLASARWACDACTAHLILYSLWQPCSPIHADTGQPSQRAPTAAATATAIVVEHKSTLTYKTVAVGESIAWMLSRSLFVYTLYRTNTLK